MELKDVVHLAVFSSGALPSLILIYILKTVKPKYHGLWIFGVIFVLIAALLAGALNLIKKYFVDALSFHSELPIAEFTLDLWMYLLPGVIAAIGANLITQYLIINESCQNITAQRKLTWSKPPMSLFNKYYYQFKNLFLDEVNDSAAIEANENLLRPLFLAILIACLSAIIILAINLAFGFREHSKLGPFGDFFGGMLNPIFTFLTFFGLIITIVIQRMELRLAREEYSKTATALNTQAIENTFFNTLDLHHEIVKGLTFDPKIFPEPIPSDLQKRAGITVTSGKAAVGREVFNSIIHEIKIRSKNPSETIDQYKFLQSKHNYVLGHYFRNFYQALKLVDRNEALDHKDKYTGILRSQLSSGELVLLFLNCLPGVVDQGEFRNLLVRYQMLEHLPLELKGTCYKVLGSTLELADDATIGEYLYENSESLIKTKESRGAFGTNPIKLPDNI